MSEGGAHKSAVVNLRMRSMDMTKPHPSSLCCFAGQVQLMQGWIQESEEGGFIIPIPKTTQATPFKGRGTHSWVKFGQAL